MVAMTSEDLRTRFEPLRRHLGSPLTQIARIQYELRGKIEDPTTGDVQLTFGEAAVLLRGGGDGTSLDVLEEAFSDPFFGDDSEETREYLATHGNLVIVDVSSQDPTSRAIGLKLTRFYPLMNEFEMCVGVQVSFEDEVFSVAVEGDEVDLIWGTTIPDGRRLVWT
jgi:hypothetical protein